MGCRVAGGSTGVGTAEAGVAVILAVADGSTLQLVRQTSIAKVPSRNMLDLSKRVSSKGNVHRVLCGDCAVLPGRLF